MTLAQHYEETILAVVGVVLIIVYIWYRLERWCGKCPYRMMCEVEDTTTNITFDKGTLSFSNDAGTITINGPMLYSDDDLEEME